MSPRDPGAGGFLDMCGLENDTFSYDYLRLQEGGGCDIIQNVKK